MDRKQDDVPAFENDGMRFCSDCGEPIEPPAGLCPACREIHRMEFRTAMQVRHQRESLSQRSKKGSTPTIQETVRAAAAAGMSYGQYVNRLEQQRRQTEAEKPAADEERAKRTWIPPARRAEVVRAILAGETTIKAAALTERVKYNTVWQWIKAARKEMDDVADKNEPAGFK